MDSLQTLSFKSLLDLYRLDRDALLSIKEKIDDMLLNVESNELKDHYRSFDVDGEFAEKIADSFMSYYREDICFGGFMSTSYKFRARCQDVKYSITDEKLFIKYNGKRWKIPYVNDEIKSYYTIPIDVVRYGAFLCKHIGNVAVNGNDSDSDSDCL